MSPSAGTGCPKGRLGKEAWRNPIRLPSWVAMNWVRLSTVCLTTWGAALCAAACGSPQAVTQATTTTHPSGSISSCQTSGFHLPSESSEELIVDLRPDQGTNPLSSILTVSGGCVVGFTIGDSTATLKLASGITQAQIDYVKQKLLTSGVVVRVSEVTKATP